MAYGLPTDPFADNSSPVGGGLGPALDAAFHNSLVTGVNDLGSQISGLESQFAGLGTEVAGLETEVTGLGNRFSGLQIYNVRDYGAAGNGTSNDTAAIQAAIDAASAAGPADPTGASARRGGIVYLPPGYYKATSTLIVDANGVRVVGASRNATVIYSDRSGFPTGQPLVSLVASGALRFASTIEYLTLNCNEVAGSIGVLTKEAQEGCALLNVRIRNYRDTGFAVHRGTAAGSVYYPSRTRVDDCEFWASPLGSNYGIDYDEAGNNEVNNTTILALSAGGVPQLAAVRVNGTGGNTWLHVRNLQLEDYADGVLALNGCRVIIDGINGTNGPGVTSTTALVHADTTARVLTRAAQCGTGNTIYYERAGLLIGSTFVASAATPTVDPTGMDLICSYDPASAGASAGFGVANRTAYFRVSVGGPISKIGMDVVTQSGNVAVAAYRNSGAGRSAVPGARIATSGSVVCPAVGYQEIALDVSVVLQPGDWLAVAADNAIVTLRAAHGSAMSRLTAGRALYQDAYPAPDPASPNGANGGLRGFALVGAP